MSLPTLSEPSATLATDMQGVWWLLTREDHTKSGELRIDPILGPDPIGILSYAKHHFAAQFMRRDRNADHTSTAIHTAQNNTSAVGGYDAYFGTYEADETTGKVLHVLIGSVTPANIGMTVSRDLRVNENTLIIQLETSTPGGEAIIRTLTWQRIS